MAARGELGDSGHQPVDVGTGGPQSSAGPHSPRHAPMIPTEDLCTVSVDIGIADAEEPDDVRVGTETTVAYGDPVLGAQSGRHEGVVNARHREGGNG